jgi:hypothetical protein
MRCSTKPRRRSRPGSRRTSVRHQRTLDCPVGVRFCYKHTPESNGVVLAIEAEAVRRSGIMRREFIYPAPFATR